MVSRYFSIRREPSSSRTMVSPEIGREDLVAAEALDLVVVGAGVGEALHGRLG